MTEATCDTIVLVHGLWMTPRSWEGWKAHYEAKGYQVLTPAYPGFEIEVEELRKNPDIIAEPHRARNRGPSRRASSNPSMSRRSSWVIPSAAP